MAAISDRLCACPQFAPPPDLGGSEEAPAGSAGRVSALLRRVLHPTSWEAMHATGDVAFNQLTAQLSPGVCAGLERALDAAAQVNVERVVRAIETGDYRSLFEMTDFSAPVVDDAALQALRQGRITLCQCCSFLFLRSFMVGYLSLEDIQRVPLFDDAGRPHRDTRHFIESTCRDSSPEISEEQIARFYTEMAKLPKTEQYFMLLPDTHPEEDNADNAHRVAQSASQYREREFLSLVSGFSIGSVLRLGGFNVFGVCEGLIQGCRQCMVPSYAMMQTIIDVSYPPETPASEKRQLCPLLGKSTNGRVMASISLDENQQIFAIFHQRFPTPARADGYVAGPESLEVARTRKYVVPYGAFTKHDGCHGKKAAVVPKHVRDRLAAFAPLLQDKLRDLYFRDMHADFIELDFMKNLFEPELGLSKESMFWASCGIAFSHSQTSFQIANQHQYLKAQLPESLAQKSGVDRTGLALSQRKINAILFADKIRTLAEAFQQHEVELRAKGITRESLRQYIKEGVVLPSQEEDLDPEIREEMRTSNPMTIFFNCLNLNRRDRDVAITT